MDGTVRDSRGRIVGQVGPDGQVWDDRGRGVGLIVSNGLVWDEIMRDVGAVKTDSCQIQDKMGQIIGQIQADGHVLDAGGCQVGTVSDAPVILTGAAGLLLLLRPHHLKFPPS
jgi:hypothetical protein